VEIYLQPQTVKVITEDGKCICCVVF